MFNKIKLKAIKALLCKLSIDGVLDTLEMIDNVFIDNLKKFNPNMAIKIEKPIIDKLKTIRCRVDSAIKSIED